MASVQFDSPKTINPFLNPTYWGREFSSTAEPWPIHKSSQEERTFAIDCLTEYVKQGMNKEPITTVYAGDSFDASAYPVGSVLYSLSEILVAPKPSEAKPMASFQDATSPPYLSFDSVEPEGIYLEGHGYWYRARPLFNVIVPREDAQVNTLVVAEADITEGRSPVAATADSEPSVCHYTVGETYCFGTGKQRALTRVSELIVCMFGNPRRYRSMRTI